MSKKKKIYYVYFQKGKKTKEGLFHRQKPVEVEEDDKEGFNGIRIIVRNEGKVSLADRNVKRLERIIKDYDVSDVVVNADKELAYNLDISDILFMARKNEFIKNCKFIMNKINERFQKTDTAVIAIESGNWNIKDIYIILNTVKNYYKKIDLVTGHHLSGINNLVETAYNEWGVVLRVYSISNYHGEKSDLAIFLLKKWRSFFGKRIPFEAAYTVTDDAMPVIRKDSHYCNWSIFYGLKYVSDVEIDDVICTQMAWQKPVLCEKFHVSVIDICEVQ